MKTRALFVVSVLIATPLGILLGFNTTGTCVLALVIGAVIVGAFVFRSALGWAMFVGLAIASLLAAAFLIGRDFSTVQSISPTTRPRATQTPRPTRTHDPRGAQTLDALQRPATTTPVVYVGYVISKVLNVRSGPGIEYTIVARLTNCAAVVVLDPTAGEWVRVLFSVDNQNMAGYLNQSYLTYEAELCAPADG